MFMYHSHYKCTIMKKKKMIMMIMMCLRTNHITISHSCNVFNDVFVSIHNLSIIFYSTVIHTEASNTKHIHSKATTTIMQCN